MKRMLVDDFEIIAVFLCHPIAAHDGFQSVCQARMVTQFRINHKEERIPTIRPPTHVFSYIMKVLLQEDGILDNISDIYAKKTRMLIIDVHPQSVDGFL